MKSARAGATRVHIPDGMATGHETKVAPTIQLEGIEKQRIERGRNRIAVAALVFLGCFVILGVRIFDLSVVQGGGEPSLVRENGTFLSAHRADILDRNGVPLALNLETQSLAANPRKILNPVEVAEKLVQVFPEMNYDRLLGKLDSTKQFVWIKRRLTPREQFAVHGLGLPGLEFRREERRVYPHGALAAHMVGFVNVDNEGIAGVEKSFDSSLSNPAALGGPLELSVDVRVQHALRDEVSQAVKEFKAVGGYGIVGNVRTGEILGMVSLPDFNPNKPKGSVSDAMFNRAALGVYEMGSTFKVFTAAAALDSGVVGVSGGYDASKPLKISRFTIRDYHAKNRWLSVPEILIHSSNIGSAKMARDLGIERHRAFLGNLGLLRRSDIELPEVGRPLLPSPWREINTMTIGFGHGLSVSPLNLITGISAVVNGGVLMPATLLKTENAVGERVMSEKTSAVMRQIMRLVVLKGSGRKANLVGYAVIGKTGTAEKVSSSGGYSRKSLLSSFVGVFPGDHPEFIVLIALDEPKGNESTLNYATGGWVSAPAVKQVIRRIGPMLGVTPDIKHDERAAPTIPVSATRTVGG